jgi:hypothetical protein
VLNDNLRAHGHALIEIASWSSEQDVRAIGDSPESACVLSLEGIDVVPDGHLPEQDSPDRVARLHVRRSPRSGNWVIP